ncbi:UDP-N-acetylmuramate dehydrogenase [bacterium]|nr:MAG: UDP-N-acetylmuramate dehydrogenase [bacterium]
MRGWSEGVQLRSFTTLRAGGPADFLRVVRTADEFAEAWTEAGTEGYRRTILGWGSNVLPADDGIAGAVIVNAARRIAVAATGEVLAESGCSMQDLCLATVQRGLGGMEFAVGIPGTLGGSLVSNAGAYRGEISDYLEEVEIQEGASRRWVSKAWMEFGYRDSRLRRVGSPEVALLRVRFKLPSRSRVDAYEAAREFQRQRIGKQPPTPSAGSFFKNVQSHELAQKLPGLPKLLRDLGKIPAGFLIESLGLKGLRKGGAMVGKRHANFLLNVGGATATDIRTLAGIVKGRVRESYGVELEEEVLYLGRWRGTW